MGDEEVTACWNISYFIFYNIQYNIYKWGMRKSPPPGIYHNLYSTIYDVIYIYIYIWGMRKTPPAGIYHNLYSTIYNIIYIYGG